MSSITDAVQSTSSPGDASAGSTADRSAIADVAPASVAIAATFTAEGLEQPLACMLDAAGLALQVEFAPYNQVFQELLSGQGTLGRNAGGVNVVLLRLQDFTRDADPAADATALVRKTADELVTAATAYARRGTPPTVFVVMEPAPSVEPALAAVIRSCNDALAAALAPLANVLVLSSVAADRLCETPRHDPVADKLAHVPYTDDYFGALAIVLARQVHLLKVVAHKVLVLDCDNTIWRGVVGEDGPEGIGLDDEFLAVQRFAVEAQSHGALICLASKNAEADVMEVFDTRPDMHLRREHIVAHRVNWQAKSENIRSLATELNLGLDAFVFLDDNPIECGAMREMLPEVVTLQLPAPGGIASFIDHLWTFDKASVTQEDLQRTAMYRQNAARESQEANAADIGEFLASLELKIAIAPPDESDWARMGQLTQRTNQFNFTTRRRSEAEMRALAGRDTVLAVRVSDRFGDYGLVGAIVAQAHADRLEMDTFLLSCRVLGRGVEHAMVAHLGRLALERGLPEVLLPLYKTAKNEPALAFANSIVATYRSGAEPALQFKVPAAFAAEIRHRAGEDAAEVIAAKRGDAAKPPKRGADPALATRSARYARLATELTSGPAVTAAWRAATRVTQRPRAAQAEPGTATERALVALWEEILGIAGIGIDDDFFALGGSSLQAARMIAEVAHARSVLLPLTTIIEAPTIRRFSLRVDQGDVADDGGLVPLREGGERKLFLVHDGDGETLLYRNLARRLPTDLDIYGIQPRRKSRIPLVHLSIEDMATAYIETVRLRQPQGPYLLGGMCAGGLIAFEMARQLERAGEHVQQVLILDAATPNLPHKAPPRDAQRSSRLKTAMKAAGEGRGALAGAVAAAGVLARKVANVASYEVGRLRTQSRDRRLVRLLERVLSEGGAWPASVRSLDFRAIYNHAERRYAPTRSTSLRALLVRARSGSASGGDMPYVDVYEDPAFGWRGLVADLEIVDVDGGHSSMLQEPHAASLASALRARLQAESAPTGAGA
jgi:FkbH-like protein